MYTFIYIVGADVWAQIIKFVKFCVNIIDSVYGNKQDSLKCPQVPASYSHFGCVVRI